MKLHFLFSMLAALLVATSSQASATITYCANGDISEVGDGLIEVLLPDSGELDVNLYESSFSIPAKDLVESNSPEWFVRSVVNKTVEVSSEGELWSSVVNLMAMYNGISVELTYSLDFAPFTTVTLDCREIPFQL